MMAELGEYAPVLLPNKIMIKLPNHFVILFGFRKEKTYLIINSHLKKNIFTILITDKKKNTSIVDRGWRESRLPRLAVFG